MEPAGSGGGKTDAGPSQCSRADDGQVPVALAVRAMSVGTGKAAAGSRGGDKSMPDEAGGVDRCRAGLAQVG